MPTLGLGKREPPDAWCAKGIMASSPGSGNFAPVEPTGGGPEKDWGAPPPGFCMDVKGKELRK